MNRKTAVMIALAGFVVVWGLSKNMAWLSRMPGWEWRSMWRTPIVFYGRVLDEKGAPVSGVKVTYGANTLDVSLEREGHVQGTVVSDAGGLFRISGLKSRGLTFGLSHPDYYNSPKNRTGISYAGDRDPNIPDTPGKAWIFGVYKKQKPANLVNRSNTGHGSMDGTPLKIDLGTYGQLIAEGTSSKPAEWDGKPFDWNLRFFIPNGEIVECNDEVTFHAPMEGYGPGVALAMSRNDKGWRTDVWKSFYIKTGNLFGRIDVFVSVYHDLYLSVHYLINPDGSTNLESGRGAEIVSP